MKVIFITGRDKKDVLRGPGISYLEKPFTLKGLLAASLDRQPSS
jgi:hypothetical protein